MPPDNREQQIFSYSPDQKGQLVSAIGEAISWVNGTDVPNLEPLENVVDTDGLKQLFTGKEGGGDFYRSSADSSVEYPQVSFEYEDCIVRVYPGNISIEPDRET